MPATRAETAAATRRALLDAAAALLDEGGPEAVTLREVGTRAGVSRSALYRHFADKDALLAAIAAAAWQRTGDALAATAETGSDAGEAVRRALGGNLGLARRRPHLYRLMFAPPPAEPDPVGPAAGRARDAFVELVARLVGEGDAAPHGGLLLAAAHGIADLELGGHVDPAKWEATPEALLDLLVEVVSPARPAAAARSPARRAGT